MKTKNYYTQEENDRIQSTFEAKKMKEKEEKKYETKDKVIVITLMLFICVAFVFSLFTLYWGYNNELSKTIFWICVINLSISFFLINKQIK